MDSNRKYLLTPSLLAITVLLSMLLVLFQGTPASANDKMESNQLIDKAQLPLQSFMCDKNMGTFRNLIRKAQGVLIAPSVLKGAFIGGERRGEQYGARRPDGRSFGSFGGPEGDTGEIHRGTGGS